jgi:hypothetical protein
MAKRILIAVLAGLMAGAPVAQSDGGGHRRSFLRSCRPHGSRLVAANRYARVYYLDEHIEYCRPGRKEPVSEILADLVYPPPAIDLAGPYLGYAASLTEGQEGADNVSVLDVRTNRRVFRADLQGAVGSLRVNRRASVAWIVCPFGHVSGRHLACDRGGASPQSVYRHDTRSTAAEPVRLLARSRRIEIRSLRRRNGSIRWRQAGKVRRASFR